MFLIDILTVRSEHIPAAEEFMIRRDGTAYPNMATA